MSPLTRCFEMFDTVPTPPPSALPHPHKTQTHGREKPFSLSSTVVWSPSSLKFHSPPTTSAMSKPVASRPSSTRFLSVTRPSGPVDRRGLS